MESFVEIPCTYLYTENNIARMGLLLCLIETYINYPRRASGCARAIHNTPTPRKEGYPLESIAMNLMDLASAGLCQDFKRTFLRVVVPQAYL